MNVLGTLLTFAGIAVFFMGYACLIWDTTISQDYFAVGSLIFVGFITTIFGLITVFKR